MTDSVRDAVFGNVGTTISFRVSADDAPILVKQFEPTFEESDIIQLNNRNFVISMIINGEKVPAFSAKTLSIPDTPKDNFDAIVDYSREFYARPRLEVEQEIRETIEQSEKFKKEISDSGRQEAPKLVIDSKESRKFIYNSNTGSTSNNTEQKPNLKYPDSKIEFRRQNLSPNEAEGKNRPGLKDLAKLMEQETNDEKPKAEKIDKPAKKGKQNFKKKARKGKNHDQKPTSAPIVPSVKSISTPVNNTNNEGRLEVNSNSSATPVRPEVVYQEKSTASIQPSHVPVSLSAPVKRTEKFANKDNSVDGFLAIKH